MNTKYRLTNTHNNSARYGNCEVCHKPVSEVFIQAEMLAYEGGYTYYGATPTLFGHESCLRAKQRGTIDHIQIRA